MASHHSGLLGTKKLTPDLKQDCSTTARQIAYSKRVHFKIHRDTKVRSAPEMNTPVNRESKEVEVCLSVFIGGLDPPRKLNQVLFDAKISDEVFGPKKERHSVPIDDLSEGFFRFSDEHRLYLQRRLSQELRSLRTIENLASSFNEDILSRLVQECAVCRKTPAKSLVHRALSATRNGYIELAGFKEAHKLMSTIASYVTRSSSRATGDRPYVCSLAVPVCQPDGECRQIIDSKIHERINSILDRGIESPSLEESHNKTAHSSEVSIISYASEDWLAESVEWLYSHDNPASCRNATKERVHEIGVTIFVGRPRLQVDDPPDRGRLSCLAFTSKWPASVIPNANKTAADHAVDFCHIVSFHETDILKSAQYRCAICSELVAARSLVHRPIAFYRSNADNALGERLRGLVMKIFQYVQGRWKFPETSAALGYKDEAHIFDFVVPICETGTICEDAARMAAREFIQLLSPRGFLPAFPGLDPDSDLYKYDMEEPLCDRETVANPVKKIGPGGLMTEKADRGENPAAGELTITKLRYWHEICFTEEEAQKVFSKGGGNNPTEEETETDKVEDNEAKRTRPKKPGKKKSGKMKPGKMKSGEGNSAASKVGEQSEPKDEDESDSESDTYSEINSDKVAVTQSNADIDVYGAETNTSHEDEQVNSSSGAEGEGEEMICIYSSNDVSEPLVFVTHHGDGDPDHGQQRVKKLIDAGVDRQLLFKPLLSLNFWLASEAVRRERARFEVAASAAQNEANSYVGQRPSQVAERDFAAKVFEDMLVQ